MIPNHGTAGGARRSRAEPSRAERSRAGPDRTAPHPATANESAAAAATQPARAAWHGHVTRPGQWAAWAGAAPRVAAGAGSGAGRALRREASRPEGRGFASRPGLSGSVCGRRGERKGAGSCTASGGGRAAVGRNPRASLAWQEHADPEGEH